MKLKNVKVGQTVKVKNSNVYYVSEYIGKLGTVQYVERTAYEGVLTVKVEFSDGETDWGNHKDIKLIEDVD